MSSGVVDYSQLLLHHLQLVMRVSCDKSCDKSCPEHYSIALYLDYKFMLALWHEKEIPNAPMLDFVIHWQRSASEKNKTP